MPVDDSFFEKANPAQMAWYQVQLNLDEKENFELLRHISEHTAMFSNPEGVQKIRDSREHTSVEKNEQFEDAVKELFGRELPKQNEELKETLSKEEINKRQIDQYLDMNLDEIKFIPCDGD